MATSDEKLSLKKMMELAITGRATDYIVARNLDFRGRKLFAAWLRLYFIVLERLQNNELISQETARDDSHPFLYHIEEIMPLIDENDHGLVREVYLFCLAWCHFIDPTNIDFGRKNLLNHISLIKPRVDKLECSEEDQVYLLGLIQNIEEGDEPNWIVDEK